MLTPMANNNQNWEDLGNSIQDVIDRAINSQDFQKLNQNIHQVVDRVVDMGNDAVRKVINVIPEPTRATSRDVKKLYGRTFGMVIKGGSQFLGGLHLSLVMLLALIGACMANELASGIFLLPVLLLCIWLTYSGIRTLGMVRRFKIYCRLLGQKTHCAIEKLAWSVNKDERFVQKDLERMIGRGLFREGYIDKEKTTLITSEETYQYYEQSRLQLEQRQKEAAAKKQKSTVSHDPQVQEVLDRGTAFIAQIRKCNDDIPGEEISEKISRIEMIVQRIFDRADAHPEIVPDLKKLMDYYLPMTVKLLNAYAEMDAQPIQGETIQSSKREIEATLDTLNLAFEKLLDSVFTETAMDVSSDISVLNTLLAQEGLTEDGFSQPK